MRRLFFRWLAVAGLGGSGACNMIPPFEPPSLPVAAEFPGPPAGKGGEGIAETTWRQFFRDPRLRKILDVALANNRDLRVTILNVEESRARYGVQQAAGAPVIDAGGNFSRQSSGVSTTSQTTATLPNLAYELDLFGRVRSLNAEALETYLATEEARRAAHLALVAEVAGQYFTWCRDHEQIALARQTLETVGESLALTKSLVEAGSTNDLDLRSAEAQLQTARVSLINFQRQEKLSANQLVLLMGQPLPPDLPARRPLSPEMTVSVLPAGLSSELLLRRPDIMEAEHLLQAANANIGAARAAFFPSVSLTGNSGTTGSDFNELFGSSTSTWGFSPQVRVPIFDGGSNRANLEVARIRRQTEVARYEKAIQSAFREVADALAAAGSYQTQLAALEALVVAQEKRYELADARYREGLDAYINVLSAQQDLFNARQSLLQTRTDNLTNQAALYKALGGGWK